MNPVLPMELLLPLLAVFAAVALVFGWRSSAALRPPLRAATMALRVLAAAGLMLLAVNPGRWKSPVERAESEWVALLDRSASMATADVNGAARWNEALRLAERAISLADDRRRVRVFTFASRLDEEAGALDTVRAKIRPDAEGTDIPGALGELFARYQARQRALAGVLLFSDGRQLVARPTDEAARQARGMAAAVHTFALGGPVSAPDLSIDPLRTCTIGFAGQPLRVAARVRNAHPEPVRPRVRLLDAAGKEVASTQVEIAPGALAEVTLTITPAPGLAEYLWTVEAIGADAIPDNNRVPAAVLALKEPMRVLVAEGVPHWDSKFLVQWLRKQPQFSLTTVHRLASERFFRIAGEGGAEDAQTRDVFPDTAEELAKYDVIVFGKGAEYFLTADRAVQLRRYVRERGGCVLFARARSYAGNFPELAEIEPLAWDQAVPPDAAGAVWRPTDDGEEAGLFGGALPGRRDAVWARMPRVVPQYFTRPLPPFSTVLVAADGGGADRIPLVAARRYGKGQTAVVNVEGLWRWDFFPSGDESSPLYKAFWPELVQWLATHGDFLPGRLVSLRLSASQVAPAESVQAILQTRGEAAERKAQPVLRVVAAGQPPQEIRPHQAPGAETWSTVLAPSQPGLYRLEAEVEGLPQAGTAIAMLRVRRAPAERDDVSADPAYLAGLAEAAGGKPLAAAGLESAVRAFDARAPDATDAPPVWDPAWDRAWLLTLLLGALGAEWFLRRRNGLL